jgi:hypothetical protein
MEEHLLPHAGQPRGVVTSPEIAGIRHHGEAAVGAGRMDGWTRITGRLLRRRPDLL